MIAEPHVAHRQRGHRVRLGWGPSRRPSSPVGLTPGTRLPRPAPNGATLCAAVHGFGADVDLAAEPEVGTVVPRMRDGFLRG